MGMEIFTESGVFKPSMFGLTAGTAIQVICVGGGGGGGKGFSKRYTTGKIAGAGGSGGGSGLIKIKTHCLKDVEDISVTVGKGGSSEMAGGSSSFGDIVSADGGAGGTSATSTITAPATFSGICYSKGGSGGTGHYNQPSSGSIVAITGGGGGGGGGYMIGLPIFPSDGGYGGFNNLAKPSTGGTSVYGGAGGSSYNGRGICGHGATSEYGGFGGGSEGSPAEDSYGKGGKGLNGGGGGAGYGAGGGGGGGYSSALDANIPEAGTTVSGGAGSDGVVIVTW